ncbi:MAG: hypothetical protein ACJ71S_12040 [Acidobacteriaceae bacterium]
MIRLTGATLLFVLHTLLFVTHPAQAASAHQSVEAGVDHSQTLEWTSREVQHVYGLPDVKPKERGSLAIYASGLSFAGKTGSAMIPRQSVIAVSAGNQRVELWGMKGRLLRMAIPNGGGLAAAAFMHHRVGMLTVEFSDSRGGYHGAVFFLPANEAEHAFQSFSQMPVVPRELPANTCQDGFVNPQSILVAAPSWDQAEVPASYRALVYEHLLDRLRQVKGAGYVYRDGANNSPQGCAQYTMQFSIRGFKQGSQVKRAMMGPIGFFAGTTQMTFDTSITDASGKVNMQEQVKATVRGESESTNVAANVANKIAKQYSMALKRSGDINMASATGIPRQ